jgi:hypothetical protein
MLSVDQKVLIDREQGRFVIRLTHPNKARVRERHWKVRVFSHQCIDPLNLGFE